MKRVLLLLFASAVSVLAQHEINWSTIDAGGGRSTGGVYVITGTIGQPDAALSSGGSYALAGGFWSAFVVQSEDAPLLRIVLNGRSVTLAWPNPSAGFQLQETPSLTPPMWSDVSTVPIVVGNEKQVAIALQPGMRFFRLRKP
jgi:hypothetical protein